MQVKADTRVLGIIGNPLGHSLSPQMHNRALEHLRLNYVYVPFVVDNHALKEAVDGIRALGIDGVNVTIPFKEAVIGYLDDLSEEARWCGAANVVKNCGGKLVGYNTDGAGFMASLQEQGVLPGGQRVVVLGAGGAARAITYHLVQAEVESLVLINRSVDRAETLAEELKGISDVYVRAVGWERACLQEAIEEADLLINTTSIGMYPWIREMPPLDPEWFHPGLVVCDIVYNPIQTRLLMEASMRGLKTVNGVGMFVHQGALAFQLLTGVAAPLEVMREVVIHLLTEGNADR